MSDQWRGKVERAIAAMCLASYKQANTSKDGTKKRKHVPYAVPEAARRLVDCLGMHDQCAAEHEAKSVMMYDYDVQQAMR